MKDENPGAATRLLGSVNRERAIIETLLDGFAIADFDETIVEVNAALCEKLGFPREELLGRNFLDLVDPADAARVREETSGRRLGRRSLYQVRMCGREGGRLEMLIAATPLLNDAGEVVGSVGVFHDVTERTQLERMLGESRRRLSMQNRTLTHLSRSPAVHSGDLAHVAARVTEAIATTMSCSSVSLFRLDKHPLQLQCEDRYEAVIESHARRSPIPGKELLPLLEALERERVLATPRVAEDERAALLYEGPYALPRATSALAVPIVTRNRLAGFLLCEESDSERVWTPDEHFFATSIADLLARAQENAERRQAEERTRAASLFPAQNPLPVMRLSREGVILFANEASAPLMRTWATTLGGSLPPRIDEKVRHSYESGERETIEVRVEGRVLALTVVPIVSEGYVNLYGSDLTELYQSMEELVTAREEALEASRVKSHFLASMSHEIRTPMNAVIGLSELLASTRLSAEQKQYAELIRSAGLALLELINDILDLSKIESGRIELEDARIALPDLVEDAISPLAVRAHEKGVELFCRVGAGMPASFRGDPARLRQVLVNIVGNAIKFTETGEVVVELKLLELDEGTRFVCCVRDSGPGITASDLESIFEAFQQGVAGLESESSGTGLGLAIASRLVRAMGGEVRVASEIGSGSAFTIDVPAEDLEQPDTTTMRRPLEGARVAVIDEHALARESLAEHLRLLGARVVEGPSAREAGALDDQDVIVVCPPVDAERADAFCAETREALRPFDAPRIRLVAQGFDCRLPPGKHPVVQLVRPVSTRRLVEEIRDAHLSAGTPRPSRDARRQAAPEIPALHVLVVEDNAVNRLLATRLLEREGHRATAVSDGSEAVDAFRAGGPFDLVLMDLQMPEMDGLEATRAIREIEETRGGHIPVVALTAHVMRGDRERCLEAGMDDFLPKPVKTKDLDACLARWAARRAPQSVE